MKYEVHLYSTLMLPSTELLWKAIWKTNDKMSNCTFQNKTTITKQPQTKSKTKSFDCNCIFTSIFPIANFLGWIYQHGGTYMYKAREREREREVERKRDAAAQYLGSQMTWCSVAFVRFERKE